MMMTLPATRGVLDSGATLTMGGRGDDSWELMAWRRCLADSAIFFNPCFLVIYPSMDKW